VLLLVGDCGAFVFTVRALTTKTKKMGLIPSGLQSGTHTLDSCRGGFVGLLRQDHTT